MEALDALRSVLCGPDGKCCIAGSIADRDIVDASLANMDAALAAAVLRERERIAQEFDRRAEPATGYYEPHEPAAIVRGSMRAVLAQPASEPPDTSKVICPNCVTQFRAIPCDVQALMIGAGFEPPFTSAPDPRSTQPRCHECGGYIKVAEGGHCLPCVVEEAK